MLNMQVGKHFERSIISRLRLLDLERVNGLFAEMETEAQYFMNEIGFSARIWQSNALLKCAMWANSMRWRSRMFLYVWDYAGDMQFMRYFRMQ